jgi:hypothetical protein
MRRSRETTGKAPLRLRPAKLRSDFVPAALSRLESVPSSSSEVPTGYYEEGTATLINKSSYFGDFAQRRGA